MKIRSLMHKKLPEIPEKIKESIEHPSIKLTKYSDKNSVLSEKDWTSETGCGKLEDGTYLVSMYCHMSGITTEMLEWWFWWHPQADIRYKVWFPGAHFAIGYDKKDKDYFNRDTCPKFKENTQYPVEKIGKALMPLSIEFVATEEFGFSREIMEQNDIPLIVCGHVGIRGLFRHTEMAHIFRKTPDGLMMCSRFWLGEPLLNPVLKKFVMTENNARSMAEHCCIEYRNLAEILPKLYEEYAL